MNQVLENHIQQYLLHKNLYIEKIDELAKGWSSVVYKIFFTNHDPIVAKVSMFNDRICRKTRFKNEQTINQYLLDINYPYTPKYYGSLEDEKYIIHFHEYLPHNVLNYPITPEAFIKNLSIILNMNAKLKLCHMDLQLSNMGINTKGEIKICDWEFAKFNIKEITLEPIGYLPYMSPKYFATQPQYLNVNELDIYAVGAGLYRLINGKFFLPTHMINAAYHQLQQMDIPTIHHSIHNSLENLTTNNPLEIIIKNTTLHTWNAEQLLTYVNTVLN